MYSRHSGGFLAKSKFNQIRLASMLQLPHLVFIFLTAQSSATTPTLVCHCSISLGITSFNCSRYHSFINFKRDSVLVFGLTVKRILLPFDNSTLCFPACSTTSRR